MNRLLSIAILLAIVPANANAETHIWLSSVAVPDGTAVIDNLQQSIVGVGGSGELNVWIRLEEGLSFLPISGISLKLVATTPGTIDFTDVTLLNPQMEITPPPVMGPQTAVRWECVGDSTTPFCVRDLPPRVDLSGRSDSEFMFTGFGVGILGGEHVPIGIGDMSMDLDPFYDSTLDAWLLASVRYHVIGTGETDLFLQIGKLGIKGRKRQSSTINVVFGSGNDPPLNAESQRERNSLTPDGSITVVEDFVAWLVTGSPVSLSQIVDTSESLVDLTFEYQFRSTTGALDVLLDGMSVGTITAPTLLVSGFTTASLRVDGEFLNRTDVALEFVLDGPARSSVLLNNIAFPDVVNGGFQTEGLAGWTIATSPRGSVQALGLSTIPEPSGMLLASVGLIGLLLGRRSDRVSGRRGTDVVSVFLEE